MPDDAGAGFFRNLSGLATAYVRQKRKALQSEPETNVDSTGGGHRYSFGGQDLTFEDLRDIKDIRDSGGQVAQLMQFKALLNFGEGAEIHVEDDDETEQPVDGEAMTLQDWLETEAFPNIDLLVLDLGEDALWYPYAVGENQETQAGGFKQTLPAEPWTLIPKCDERGEIVVWKQRTRQPSGGYTEQTIPGEDLWHIPLNKASARDKTGISEVLRNKDEIQAFKQNEQAINKAIELHGFPQRHVIVGREEGAPVSDTDLRRVRSIFDPRTTESNTAYFTGQDVEVDTLEAHNFDYSAIHEMDMRNLTTALGLPLEAGNVGSDGLGSGKPAELRFALLKLAIKANQRSFSVQFVEKVMRPAIRDYSPFDHTATVTLDIGDPLEDIGEVADLLGQIGDYMTNNEARRKLDLPEPEDDDIGESYRSPADIEAAEEGDGQGGGPFGGDGGLFSDGRMLQEIPDNAVSIDSPAEAPDDAQVISGPQGGTYYVPGAGDDGDGADAGGDVGETVEDFEDLDSGDYVEIDATIRTPQGEVDIGADAVEVTQVTEFGIAIDHPEHGSATLTPDEMGDITRAEEPGPPDAEQVTEAAAPDISAGTQTDQHGEWEEGFTLDASENEQSLADLGASQGKTAEHMTVHEMSDGSTAFVKEFGEDGIDPTSRDQTLTGYEVMKQVAPENVPAHAVSEEGEMIATEGVDGHEIGALPDDVADRVDHDEFMQASAAQALMGNDDARPENIVIEEDGTPQFIDLDEAGDELEGDLGERDLRDSLRRAASSWSELSGDDPQDAVAAIGEQVKAARGDVDTDAIREVEGTQGGIIADYVEGMDDEQIDAAVEDAQGWF